MCLCALVMVHGYLIQFTEYVVHHLQVRELTILLQKSVMITVSLHFGQPVLSPNVSVHGCGINYWYN